MIRITDDLLLDEQEIELSFTRSPGPGGQNVNKVASSVRLRFPVLDSPSLPEAVRRRLLKLAGRRLTGKGVLIIQARRFRTQERNRRDAIQRLIRLIREATIKPKPRRRTGPSASARRRRLEAKHRRGALKQQRRPVDPET